MPKLGERKANEQQRTRAKHQRRCDVRESVRKVYQSHAAFYRNSPIRVP
jgi:hypothetical protein